jgi:bifunctional non-homologous end joining protein LigD
VRRGAFHVEDHPLEYFDFEGVIPSREYGGGDVIVWDAGTWLPYKTDDPQHELATGELHAELHGVKLRGQFVIVRTNVDKDEWLLLHKRDEFAVEGWDAEDYPTSVLSGRTNDEVKADPDRMWRSDLPAARASILLNAAAVDPVSDAELAELAALPAKGTWPAYGRELRLTDLDRAMFAPRTKREKPITKREFIGYAARLAPTALPHLRRRALSMHRFAHGTTGRGTWRYALPNSAPDWLPRWTAADGRPQLVVDEPAALVWAANLGALEWCASTATIEQPEQPTHAVFDLAPGRAMAWSDLLVVARLFHTALDHVGVRGTPKLTGHDSVEIWIPIRPGPSPDELLAWTDRLAETVAAVVPELAGWSWRPDKHGPLAPYSSRPAAGAPVSVPISWAELDDRKITPAAFTIRNVLDRIRDHGNAFAAELSLEQRLPPLT